MAKRKHLTLTANTEATITVTGRGVLLVSNHGVPGTAVPEPLYVALNATATVQGDEMIPVMGGRPRVVMNTDQDGSVDVHVICVNANKVSVEMEPPGIEENVV